MDLLDSEFGLQIRHVFQGLRDCHYNHVIAFGVRYDPTCQNAGQGMSKFKKAEMLYSYKDIFGKTSYNGVNFLNPLSFTRAAIVWF